MQPDTIARRRTASPSPAVLALAALAAEHAVHPAVLRHVVVRVRVGRRYERGVVRSRHEHVQREGATGQPSGRKGRCKAIG